MKITDTRDAALLLIKQYQKAGDVKPLAEKVAAPNQRNPEEKVDISAKAKEFTDIKNVVNGLPDIRNEKVQALQSRIDRGIYEVPAEDLARKIVGENILDLFA